MQFAISTMQNAPSISGTLKRLLELEPPFSQQLAGQISAELQLAFTPARYARSPMAGTMNGTANACQKA